MQGGCSSGTTFTFTSTQSSLNASRYHPYQHETGNVPVVKNEVSSDPRLTFKFSADGGKDWPKDPGLPQQIASQNSSRASSTNQVHPTEIQDKGGEKCTLYF